MTAEVPRQRDAAAVVWCQGWIPDVYVVEITMLIKVIIQIWLKNRQQFVNMKTRLKEPGRYVVVMFNERLHTDGLRGRNPRIHLLQVAG